MQGHTVGAQIAQHQVPLLVVEIEGSKDVWGKSEELVKAIMGGAYGLCFMPVCYLMVVTNQSAMFYRMERDPPKDKLIIERYEVDLTGQNLQQCFMNVVDMILEILLYMGSIDNIGVQSADDLARCSGFQQNPTWRGYEPVNDVNAAVPNSFTPLRPRAVAPRNIPCCVDGDSGDDSCWHFSTVEYMQERLESDIRHDPYQAGVRPARHPYRLNFM
jgi:hypothetical protein